MKWLSRLLGLLLGLMALDTLREFLERNRILIINDDNTDIEFEDEQVKDINELKPDYQNAMDLRGTPTHVCVCGCNIWNLKVMFNDGQISQYFLDMECANCGSLATAPTPIDNRNELD